MGNEEERNRIKEEYKAHYLKIKELKQKLSEAERVKKLSNAIDQINPRGLLDQFDNALDKVREKIFVAEEKLNMAIDSAEAEQGPTEEDEAVIRKQKAAETMRQMKMELGMLNDAVEEQASKLPVDKTLGKKPEFRDPTSNPLAPNTSSKSIGRSTKPDS